MELEKMLIEQLKVMENYDDKTIMSFLNYIDNLINTSKLTRFSAELTKRIYHILSLSTKNGEELGHILLINAIMNNAKLSPTLLIFLYMSEKKQNQLDQKVYDIELTDKSSSSYLSANNTLNFNYYYHTKASFTSSEAYNYQMLEEIFNLLSLEEISTVNMEASNPTEQLAISDFMMYSFLKDFVDQESLQKNMLYFYNARAKAQRKTLNFVKKNNVFSSTIIHAKENELQEFYHQNKDAREKYHRYLRQIGASLKPIYSNSADSYKIFKEHQNKINRVIINEEKIIAKIKQFPSSYTQAELGLGEYSPLYPEDDLITFLNSVKMTQKVYGPTNTWLKFLINGDTSGITRENGARESIEMLNYKNLKKAVCLKLLENIANYLTKNPIIKTNNPVILYVTNLLQEPNKSTMHILLALEKYILNPSTANYLLEILENRIPNNSQATSLDPKVTSILPELLNTANIAYNPNAKPELKEQSPIEGIAKTYLEAINITLNKYGNTSNWLEYLKSGNLKVITSDKNARSSLKDLDYQEVGDEMVLISLQNILNYLQNSHHSHNTNNSAVNKIINVFGRSIESYSGSDLFEYCKKFILSSNKEEVYELFTNSFSSLNTPRNTPLAISSSENIAKIIKIKKELRNFSANSRNKSKLEQEQIKNSTLKSRFQALSQELAKLLDEEGRLNERVTHHRHELGEVNYGRKQ